MKIPLRYFDRLLFLANLFLTLAIITISQPQNSFLWHQLGKLSGQAATLIFGITLLPGILKRLKQIKLWPWGYALLTKTRKQFGIMMFLLSLAHTLWSYNLLEKKIWPEKLSDWMGLAAILILLPLFITSNEYSLQKLKTLWYKIHLLTHVAVWFILFHIVIKSELSWSIITAAIILADVTSWVYYSNLVQYILSDI